MEESTRNLVEKLMREAASYGDTMIGIGVAVDKAQILTGQPTQITQSRRDPGERWKDALDKVVL